MPAARRSPEEGGRIRGRDRSGFERDDRDSGRRRDRNAREDRRPTRPARGNRSGSDLLARVAVAVPAAVAAIVLDDLGGTAWMVAMIVLGIACMYELYRMLDRWRPLSVVGFGALIGMCVAARYGGLRDVVEVAAGAVPVLFAAFLLSGRHEGATVSIAGTLLGIYWLGLAFASSVLLRDLPEGKGIVIDVMVGTFIGDTGAYVGGRLFGRRPLAAAVSPNKTIEGLFCGMLAALVAVLVARLYQSGWTPPFTEGDAFGLGIAIAILGPMGDLFESLIKRDAGAKDAGSLFGAHGGALDRLDAVSFTVVAAYFIWATISHA